MAGLLYLFDAPKELLWAFRHNGFRPYGGQQGAWCRSFDDRMSAEARDIEYELTGVGLLPRWRTE